MPGDGPQFIPKFTAIREGTEVPERFALWTALAGAGAVLGRDVAIPRGNHTLYPNLFVVLVGGSGTRKSTPLSQLQDLMIDLPTPVRLTAHKGTPEALIEELKQPHIESSVIQFRSEGFGIYSEFVSFMNRRSSESGMVELVCRLYDCKRRDTYRTRYKGEEVLDNVWFGFVGAATVEGLRMNLPEETIGDGLTSRIIFVSSTDRPPPVPFPSDKSEELLEAGRRLAQLQEVGGVVEWSDDGVAVFNEEYQRAYYDHPFLSEGTLAGYLNRRDGHIAKLATILAADQDGYLVIEGRHVREAVRLLEDVEADMPDILQSVETNAAGHGLRRVEETIKSAGEIQHSSLLRKVQRRMTARELRDVIDTLRAADQIDMRSGAGGGFTYRWKGETN